MPSPTVASTLAPARSFLRSRKAEDLVYQAMTAAAMLITLLSICLF